MKTVKESWQERLAQFLREPRPSAAFSRIDEAALPYAAWTLATPGQLLLLPDVKAAEQLAAQLEMLNTAFGESRRVVLLPELPAGKLRTSESESEFMATLFGILKSLPHYILATAGVLTQVAPKPGELAASELVLTPGYKGFTALLERLVKLDYDDEFEVAVPGEFARRGGIIDLFSPAHDFPVRLDFWGDELESIRRFAPDTQRSVGTVQEYRVIARSLPELESASGVVGDYVKHLKLLVTLIYPEQCYARIGGFAGTEALSRFEKAFCAVAKSRRAEWGDAAQAVSDRRESELFGCFPAVAHLIRLLPEEVAAGSIELIRDQISAQVRQWLETGYTVVAGAGRDGMAREHIDRWCCSGGIPPEGLEVADMALPPGVILPASKLVLLNERELFAVNLQKKARSGQETMVALPPRRKLNLNTAEVVADLTEGDFAVHIAHGIGIFRGIKVFGSRSGGRREVMVLEYADEKLLYVPMLQAHLVSKYLGSAGKAPLHRLNSRKWQNDKTGAMRAVREYAADLLRMQAVRYSVPGLPIPEEDYEQLAFENAVDFDLTEDQKRAVADIKSDLGGEHPMDRLLCGDVGFGKTEVAMVAAFRMVYNGYQVAVLAPTTVLAQQHFYSFRERFAEFGINIEMVSRFRSAKEQKEVLARATAGKVDIIIGTHRLCQRDVAFANLGLVIIDEEQRFGVKHKERMREMRASVHVLSMSATPIPRTLYLAMVGARDLSTIMTAPLARLPVKTMICEEGDPILLGAINLELARGGQVYYLYNRVKTITKCESALREQFPNARIAVAHGQMDEHELEAVMAAFLAGDIDILVCTTIIESGINVRNANTIIIDRADRFGLAELYQLRGRVGRWIHQAYACLMLPKSGLMTLDGRKRIAAIRRYTHLGAGFQLALRDLEIRGAGNLLGQEQSGHVKAIGFELYCHLLTSEIKALKGEQSEFLPEVELALEFISFAWEAEEGRLPVGIPPEYIESLRLRVEAYRKVARVNSVAELEGLRGELIDRYGRLPEPVGNLLALTLVRVLSARQGYCSVTMVGDALLFRDVGGGPFRLNGKLPVVMRGLKPERKLTLLVEFARKLTPAVYNSPTT